MGSFVLELYRGKDDLYGKGKGKEKVVHSLLDKVKSKAVAAVQDKYTSNMEAAFKEDLYGLPKETQDALFTFISSVNAMYAAATKLDEIAQRDISEEQEEKRKELENKINCINKEALFPCGDNK